ncbi:M16 family metallopeptidase [Aestuariirhabdus litorea]|uniref:Insulinase family protein n=1 Tax=Aestuariirhabdus litorea TaxID=2528527 RepID=A0A3P3VJX9_9GAMM|nr:pitrilysin family protein [Aestuariirhabdus litorea]RRJ82684.1 insulinase family protein [Aestuariirhabdus litorea]RWW92844.1 insulinase family protein [Endozoicomonadaceae bacterium GTF-13]
MRFFWLSGRLASLLGLLFISSQGFAAASSTHEYVLPNGLKLIVREDHRAPVVVSQVWYRIGSSYESVGHTGLSHLLEHMMFKDSKRLETGEFSRIMARVGASENAFTSRDATAYYQVLAANRLPLSFELEAERMQNLVISDEEFTRERQVVLEERRQRVEDRPEGITYERFQATAHQASPYGNPVIGWQQDLESMQADDLRRWYQNWYSPNNAIVVVVGDVDPEEVLQLATRYFGPIPARPHPQVKPLVEINTPGARRIEMELETARLPSLYMGFNVPVLNTAEQEWETYALRMLSGVLDGGYSARIETRLVRGSEVASSAGVGYSAFSRGDSLFTFSGVPNTQKGHDLEELESAFWEQIEQLKQTPPSQQELDRIKAQVISSLVYEQDSISSQAQQIGILESIGQSWRVADQELDRLNAITPEQIQQVAQKYLTRERVTVATLSPKATASQ